MLVWWHWVQTASTVSLPAPCGSAAGRPCSWAWAANGTNANTAAAIKETVEGPDMFNLPTACSEACLRTAAYEKSIADETLSCPRKRASSGHRTYRDRTAAPHRWSGGYWVARLRGR